MGWDTLISAYQWGFTLQYLLVLLTQRNKSTAANPALQITACKATRKASSITSFSLSSGFSPVLDDQSFSFYVLSWDSDPHFLACFTPCFLFFTVFETPLSKPARILFLICTPRVEAWRFKVYHSLVRPPVLTLGTQQKLCFSTLTSILICAPKKGTGHGN